MLLCRFIFAILLFNFVNSEIVEIIQDNFGNETEIWTPEDYEIEEEPDSSPIPEAETKTTLNFYEECLPKLDLVFLLDTSGSIEEIYQEHVRWAVALVDSLQIEPDAVHVAAVQYAGFPLTEFALGTYPSVEDIRQHLKQINFQSGVTRTGYALRKAEAELFREDRGARKDALKVIILFTDGLSIDDPLKPAAQLRDLKGVKIYVVSVGDDGFESEMSRIAGDKQNVFGPDELSRLRTALLNDAERARACSQIGPSWFRKHESTTLKPPASILNQGILPPLDFLELAEESSKEKTEKEIKKVIGEVKPEVEFLLDNKNKINLELTDSEDNLETILVDNTNEDINDTVDGIPTTESSSRTESSSSEATTVESSASEATKVESSASEATELESSISEATKVESSSSEATKVESSSSEAAKVGLTENSNFTTVQPITMKSETPLINKSVQKTSPQKSEKKIDEESPSAQRIFAVPVFRPPAESENVKDVFDMTEEERKQFLSFKPNSKSRSSTVRPATSTTRRSTTVKPTTTKKIRTTAARKSSSTVVTSRPTTTRRITTTPKPRTTTRSRFTRPSTSRIDGKCPIDLLFLVDSSGSVQKIYDEQKEFLKQILQETNIQEDVHRVALLQFAGSAIQKTEWSFDTFSTNSDLTTALDRVRLITGTTYIGAALENALQLLGTRRRNVPTVVVLVSDGFSQDDATVPAERIRKLNNVEFYSLSIAELTNSDYLAQLVGDEKNIYFGRNIDQLKNLLIKKLHCS